MKYIYRSVLRQFLQRKYTLYYTLFDAPNALFLWILVGVIRVVSVKLVIVLSVCLYSLRVHSISTLFISLLLNPLHTMIWVNYLVTVKDVRISETRHDRSNPITWKVQFMLTFLLFSKLIRGNVMCVPLVYCNVVVKIPYYNRTLGNYYSSWHCT